MSKIVYQTRVKNVEDGKRGAGSCWSMSKPGPGAGKMRCYHWASSPLDKLSGVALLSINALEKYPTLKLKDFEDSEKASRTK